MASVKQILTINNHDRVVIAGGSESGKSTIAAGSKDFAFNNTILGRFHYNYKDSKILIVDSKPRFRAQYKTNGLSDKKTYASWSHGAYIPTSIRCDLTIEDLDLALARSNIVICQSDDIDNEYVAVANLINHFRNNANTSESRLVFIDEIMDFYTSNGTPKSGTGNMLIRCARAGAERNISTVIATQRLKGIPPQFFELCTRIYLFRLDYTPDYKRLQEAGAPKEFLPPLYNHEFKLWDKKNRDIIEGVYKIQL